MSADTISHQELIGKKFVPQLNDNQVRIVNIHGYELFVEQDYQPTRINVRVDYPEKSELVRDLDLLIEKAAPDNDDLQIQFDILRFMYAHMDSLVITKIVSMC